MVVVPVDLSSLVSKLHKHDGNILVDDTQQLACTRGLVYYEPR